MINIIECGTFDNFILLTRPKNGNNMALIQDIYILPSM